MIFFNQSKICGINARDGSRGSVWGERKEEAPWGYGIFLTVLHEKGCGEDHCIFVFSLPPSKLRIWGILRVQKQ